MGYSPWDHKESDTIERLQLLYLLRVTGKWDGRQISQCPLSSFMHAAAAAAKSLQSCPTLCDPIVGSPPGSAVTGTLQARTLEWVAISFSKA